LTQGQTGHFRIVATNQAGAVSGLDQSFTASNIPPSVTTLAVSGSGTASQTLNGTVNPNGLATSAWFEWGTTGTTYTVLSTTNVALPISNWISLGTAAEATAGQFQFTDTTATNGQRFYRLRLP
jgi:hypothetical protein